MKIELTKKQKTAIVIVALVAIAFLVFGCGSAVSNEVKTDSTEVKVDSVKVDTLK